MSNKTGGTILVGCKLGKDKKRNPKIKGAGTRYKS